METENSEYLRVIHSIFLEITLVFTPKSFSEDDLKWKAERVVKRLEETKFETNFESNLILLNSQSLQRGAF